MPAKTPPTLAFLFAFSIATSLSFGQSGTGTGTIRGSDGTGISNAAIYHESSHIPFFAHYHQADASGKFVITDSALLGLHYLTPNPTMGYSCLPKQRIFFVDMYFNGIAGQDFSCSGSSQNDIYLDIRENSTRTPLSGYLFIRRAPPDANLDVDLSGSRSAYYNYFRNFATDTSNFYSIRGRNAAFVENGQLALSMPNCDVKAPNSTTQCLQVDDKVWVYFFWKSGATLAPLSDTASISQKIAQTDRVTWWTLDRAATEQVSGRSLLQFVRVMSAARWTEALDVDTVLAGSIPSASGVGYFKSHVEMQSYVLQPTSVNTGGNAIDTSKSSNPLLLVHGINGDADYWRTKTDIPGELRSKGVPVWEFYYSRGQDTISDCAKMLSSAVAEIQLLLNDSSKKLMIASHSYGGVVTRYALHTEQKMRDSIIKLLMIGPPHHGSYSAARVYRCVRGTCSDLRDHVAILQRMGLKTNEYNDPYAPIYGELTPGSPKLLEMAASPNQAFAGFAQSNDYRQNVFVIAGNRTIPGITLFHTEAGSHDDGAVSISSASLLPAQIALGIAPVNHFEEVEDPNTLNGAIDNGANPRIVDIIAQFASQTDPVSSFQTGLIPSIRFFSPNTTVGKLSDVLLRRGGLVVDLSRYDGSRGDIAEVTLSGHVPAPVVGYKTYTIVFQQALPGTPNYFNFYYYASESTYSQLGSWEGLAVSLDQDIASEGDGIRRRVTVKVKFGDGTTYSEDVDVLALRTTTKVLACMTCSANAKAVLSSPNPGSVLPSASATFSWNAVSGATAYWLDVGTAKGQGNIWAGQLASSVTSQAVSGIPTNGSTIFVRLWTQRNGAWQYNDYTYTAATFASIGSPTPGSTLTGASVTFSWNAVSGATAYWLDVGTIKGQGNIWAGQLAASITSKAVTGVPTTGIPIYVRLWTQVGGAWQQYNDYTYTAANTGAIAAMSSPTPGTSLTGSSVTFTWNAISGATAYWLDVGTIKGQGNVWAGQLAPSVTSRTVTGIPANGSTIFVRLWTQRSGAWQYNDYAYTAAKLASISNPTPGSTLTGASVTFSWNAVSGATAYWLDVGTAKGQGNIWAGQLASSVTSRSVTGIPTTGVPIYVRLWTLLNGTWQSNDHTYTAANIAIAGIVSPTPGSILILHIWIQTFSWNAVPNATSYWLDVGTAKGQGNIWAGQLGPSITSQAVGITSNGTIYVRLWTQLNGTWRYNDYTYTAELYNYVKRSIQNPLWDTQRMPGEGISLKLVHYRARGYTPPLHTAHLRRSLHSRRILCQLSL